MELLNDIIIDKSKNQFHQFIAEIEFGMPGKDCQNYGICRVTIPTSGVLLNAGKQQKTVGIVTILNNQKIEIDFIRLTITSEKYKKFFASGTFLTQGEFKYPALEKVHKGFTIPKGRYPIVESNSIIKVSFH